MSQCMCCQDLLLRHARKGGVYWYCPSCRQEMPNLQLEHLVMIPQHNEQLDGLKVPASIDA